MRKPCGHRWGHVDTRESGQLAHGGVAWQPTPHLQLDLHAGRRIAGDFPESFVALGLSFRRGP